MRVFNKIIIAFEGFCAVGFIWCMIGIFFLSPGIDPQNVLSAVDLNLKDYKIENKSDNLVRGSSRWDNFTYHISFSPEENLQLEKQMKADGWQRVHNEYSKIVEVNDDLTYSAFVNPKERTATLDVLIDEDYRASLIYKLGALLCVTFAFLIGVLWGVVKLVCKTWRWLEKKRNK